MIVYKSILWVHYANRVLFCRYSKNGIIRIKILHKKLSQNNLTFWKKDFIQRLADFSLPGKILYFKSRISYLKKMIAAGLVEEKVPYNAIHSFIWLWYGPVFMHFKLLFLRGVKLSSWPQSDSHGEALLLWACLSTLGCMKENVVCCIRAGT